MLHLLQEAINPQLGLRRSLCNWPMISLDLREAPRKRTLQSAQIEQNYFTLS